MRTRRAFLGLVLVALVCGQHVAATAGTLSQVEAVDGPGRNPMQAGPKASGDATELHPLKPAGRSLTGAQGATIIPLIIKGLIFIGLKISAAAKSSVAVAAAKAAVSGAVGAGITIGATRSGGSPPTIVCNGPCSFWSLASIATSAGRASVNGCSSEACLCAAMGPGVHPNMFDASCSTFFHCPGPKRSCGPGTLFNPQFNVCDYPPNVRCVAIALS